MNYNETEIDIKEILCRILVWWKVLLLLGMLAGVIAAGWGYAKDTREYDKTIESLSQADKTYEQLVTTLSASSIKQYDRIKNAASLLSQYKAQLAYADNSYLMKFETSEVTSVNLIYRVNSENSDAKVLLQVYQTYFTQQAQADAIAKLLPEYDDGKYKYIGQVLTVSSNSDEEKADSYYLKISARLVPGTDQKALTAGLEAMVENSHKELVDKGFAHTIVKYDESTIKKDDSYISDAKEKYEKNKSDLETNIVKLNLTKQEQDLLYSIDLSEIDNNLKDLIPKPQVSKKYIAIGVLLVWAVFAGIIIFRMSVPVKIGTSEQFGNVKQLGTFRRKPTSNRVMSILSSKGVYNLFNRKNQDLERLKRNVRYYLKLNHYGAVCIRTASNLSHQEKIVATYIENYLTAEKFVVDEKNTKIIFIYDINRTKTAELEELIKQEPFDGTEVFGMIGLEC